jgi:hypothetical protein
MKMLGFLPRRGDMTRAAFREYYERKHAPLALEHLRVFEKYVRNHLADAAAEPGFDTISEFWYADRQAAVRVGAWLATPQGQVLRRDEERFMDRSRIGSCVVTERALHGPRRGFEPPPLTKLAVLFLGPEPLEPEALADVERWSRAFVETHEHNLLRATLDVPTSALPEHLTVRALLWLWPRDADAGLDLSSTAPPAPVTWLAVDAIETPPAMLRDRIDG